MTARERILVDTSWVVAHLDDPSVVILEVDERPLIYRAGHIPGAHCIDWHTELQDPLTRDIPDAAAILALWNRVGITANSTVVFYGDKNNWYAAFAFWVFRIYGVTHLHLLDGGRQAWISEELPLEHLPPPPNLSQKSAAALPQRDDQHRADRRTVRQALNDGRQLLDVRTRPEYRGDIATVSGWPDEGAQRSGHIPTALHVPWEITIGTDGKLLPDDELREQFARHGVDLTKPAITYCRIGERSAHTWLVLTEILGTRAQNYDGSWAEWGSMIGMPIAIGDEP